MQDSFRHCQDLVRAADKDRFLSALFAPADRRGHLFALYAFNIEVARVRERAGEPLPGEIRLQWWRDVLEGGRAEEASANPIAASLTATLAEHGLAAAPLIALLEARTFDLYDDPMQTLDELETYARRTSSALIELAGAILGAAEDHVSDVAAPAGIAYAITGLLRSFALHASRRQLFVPMDILRRHGVELDDVFAGRSAPGLAAALAELRGHARRHLDAVRNRIGTVPNDVVPALLPVALVRGYLDRMERRDYDPLATVVDVPQWRRQWVLWRSARRRAIA